MDEQKEFREAYFDKELTSTEAKIIFKKLCRHFKVNCSIYFWGYNSGRANGWRIIVPYRCNFGILAHEISHMIDKKKRRSKHDKKLMRIIRRVNNYYKKKNYWEIELNKRTEIKVKPEPTKRELQLIKIRKKKEALARYEKRLQYFNKLYNNKIKKANRSLMMLERNINPDPRRVRE